MTWMQSSRVGVRTSACVSSEVGSMYCSIGRPKAAVLPVPVCAWPITSWPSSSSGIACSWIGEGSVNPSSSIAFWICSESPSPLKSLMKRRSAYAAGFSRSFPEVPREAIASCAALASESG